MPAKMVGQHVWPPGSTPWHKHAITLRNMMNNGVYDDNRVESAFAIQFKLNLIQFNSNVYHFFQCRITVRSVSDVGAGCEPHTTLENFVGVMWSPVWC